MIKITCSGMAASGCSKVVGNLPLAISWFCFTLCRFLSSETLLAVSRMPPIDPGLRPTSGALCHQKREISFLVVLAEGLVLTLMASARGLSLPAPITVVNRMEGSDWPGVGHMSPLGGGVSPSPTTRPESRG